jgi:hypothetical protein
LTSEAPLYDLSLPGVPVTACIVMVLAEFASTRPIAVLLSHSGRLDEE